MLGENTRTTLLLVEEMNGVKAYPRNFFGSLLSTLEAIRDAAY